MIESMYWRQELRSEVAWLRRKRRFGRWSEKQQVLYERSLMLVAFQIRSLLERPKVCRAFATKRLTVTRYEKKRGTRPFTRLDIDLEEHFNLESPMEESLSAPQVCNQLIHHHIMFAVGGPGEFSALLVASDYRRKSVFLKSRLLN